MKKVILAFVMILFTTVSVSAQNGYILAGWTNSFTHGPAGGDSDFLIYRLDASGNTMWRKNYGGTAPDQIYNYLSAPQTVIRTSDGGYLLVGYSTSYTNGGNDFLVYKLDANGNKQWRKNYGGQFSEDPLYMDQTADGGFLLTGDTSTYTHGPPDVDRDFLVYKIDAAGNKQWRKNYGGIHGEILTTLLQTSDGGFVLAGWGSSFVHGTPGSDSDLLVYKLDAKGNKQWRKNYGGTYSENHFDTLQVQETSDGGYIMQGMTASYTHGTPGLDFDYLLYKLDGAGNKMWRKNYGGMNAEYLFKTRQTSDGGFAMAGTSESYASGPPGDRDMLVYRLDAKGKKLWRKNYGGIMPDGWTIWPFSAVELFTTADGGFILAGDTQSFTLFPGFTDFLVYKLDAAGKKQWRKNYGGALSEPAPYSYPISPPRMTPTSDGGYLMAGNTESFTHGWPGSDTDFIAYKLDANGNVQWWNYWGGLYLDVLTDVLEVTH